MTFFRCLLCNSNIRLKRNSNEYKDLYKATNKLLDKIKLITRK